MIKTEIELKEILKLKNINLKNLRTKVKGKANKSKLKRCKHRSYTSRLFGIFLLYNYNVF